MSRIVAVPNWSFCNSELSREAESRLVDLGVEVHYCQGDIDHQRTVTAFSGESHSVYVAAIELARSLLPNIDLRLQHGVHPRVGALDVMPFVALEGSSESLIEPTREWAKAYTTEFEIPTYLYEMAAFEGRECRLPALRGQLGPIDLPYDFGVIPHPRWGTTIVGVRNFLLAANINISTQDLALVKRCAKAIRDEREVGNPRLTGVRALGFRLDSRNLTQLSLNFVQPDKVSFDVVYEFASSWLSRFGIEIAETELIGVARSSDIAKATKLQYAQRQVVDQEHS